MKAKRFTEFALAIAFALTAALGVFTLFFGTSAKAWVAYTIGKSFDRQGYYHMENKLNLTGADDFTIDAEVWIPSEHYGWRNGVLFSDYLNDGTTVRGSYLEFTAHGEILVSIENGPEFKFATKYITTHYDPTYFGGANDPKSAHFTFVIDMEDVAGSNTTTYSLYMNGQHLETVDENSPLMLRNGAHLNQGELANWDTVCIGGDRRINNSMALTGRVQSVAMYKDVRTPEEIAASAAASTFSVDKTDANLLAAYDMTGNTFATDLSNNGNDLVYQPIVGTTFTADYPLQQKEKIVPRTMETWLYVPTANASYVGTIFGNYSDEGSSVASLSFEIYYNGVPRFYYKTPTGTTRYTFDQVDVRTNDWAHLALTHSGSEIKIYLNGVLAQTVTGVPDYNGNLPFTQIALGGDIREGNPCYFKGYMRDFTAYTDARSDAEIAADYKNGPSLTDANIACYYDLTKVTSSDHVVKDSSSKGNDLERQWMTEGVLDLSKYAYSFAVVGDPQKLLYYDLKEGTNNYSYIFDWLSNPNVIKEKNIQLVLGMGDTVDSRTVDAEYEYAARELEKLTQAGLPWQFVQGNHDELQYYDRYFGDSDNFKNMDIHYYTGPSERPGRQDYYIKNPQNLGSFYVNYTIGETEWMIFTLDYGVEDNILDWASEEIRKNPTKRVIITTHAYINGEGDYVDDEDESSPSEIHNTYNDGDDIWEKLINKHRNIVMVLCGHCGAPDIVWRQDRTYCGTKVTQMLVNPQTFDPTYDYKTGMVALLHFTEDGRDVGVEYYSTVRGQYYKLVNQFEFNLIDYYGNGIYEIQTINNPDGTTTLRYLYTNGTYEDVVVGGAGSGNNGADGADGKTPYIGTNGNWWIGTTDTGVKAQGQQGAQGPAGSNGANGADGADGETPYIGTNGNWWIGTTDTGVAAQGQQGAQGPAGSDGANGADGEDGADGKTPYIGDNGNWWIGDTDTGVAAQGPKGDKGDKGDTGSSGADGKDGGGCKKASARTLALLASVMALASVMLFGKKR